MSYTQENRAFRWETTLGRDKALLESFEGREAVSQPFHFRVRFLSLTAVNLESLLGTAATLTAQRRTAAGPHFHGHLWSIRQCAASADSLFCYEAELVPKFRFLELQAHCRIFHNQSAKQIITTVFGERGLTDFEFDLQGDPPAREYCVQYRETDFHFVSRLLEEEGIYYFFRHEPTKHTLVLSDKKSGLPACPVHATAVYRPVTGDVLVQNPVFEFESMQRLGAGRVSLSDYNFETPKVNLEVSMEGGATGELFEFPGCYPDKSAGDRLARIRLEEQEASLVAVNGTSACDGFRTGHTFSLTAHRQSECNRAYLLLEVKHKGRNAGYQADSDSGADTYENHFTAIPASTPYRPPRLTPKALVRGTQTAVVTGPDGEEIYVDEYGRIQVRFFWNKEQHSCWVRVAQTWAGKNWGAASWPRVGQEVVVDFLEGDPDRPLVIGGVYNADQMPPYALPENKTRAGVRSRSSRGGSASNANEIYLEDKTGQEKMFIQAEKDQEIQVKHDRTMVVANDETIRVGHNRTANISTTDTVTAGTNITMSAGQEIKLSSPGGSITIGPSGIEIMSPGTITIRGSMVLIN